MTQQQNQSVVRSQTWNSAIVMSEAGVEDALAMLNKFNSNFDKLTNWASSTLFSSCDNSATSVALLAPSMVLFAAACSIVLPQRLVTTT